MVTACGCLVGTIVGAAPSCPHGLAVSVPAQPASCRFLLMCQRYFCGHFGLYVSTAGIARAKPLSRGRAASGFAEAGEGGEVPGEGLGEGETRSHSLLGMGI